MRYVGRTTTNSSAVATSASAAPTPNAAGAPNAVHTTTEDDAGGERAEAVHGVVDAEREAAPRRRREIGDERFLGAFGEAEVEAVRQEPREQAPAATSLNAKPA